jgi:hypothetical protein
VRTPLVIAPLALLVACRGLEPPDRPPPGAGSPTLALEPDASADAAPAVVRLRVGGAAPDGVLVFEGELGSYHLRRIAAGDLPQTLLQRRVPAVAWTDASDPDTTVVAPSVPLSAGLTYSLASPERGLLATLRIRTDGEPPRLDRLWPPIDGGAGAGHAVFCGDAAPGELDARLELEPDGTEAELSAGAAAGIALGSCVRLAIEPPLAEPAFALAPALWAGIAFDPAPLVAAAAPRVEPLGCDAGEVPLGPGCASVLDDRVLVRSPDEALLWIVGGDALAATEPLAPGQTLIVRGLVPGASARLELTVVDRAGRATRLETVVETSAPVPHLVLNEVMANPLGPEPEQEWIEIANDGSEPVALGGFVLEDAVAAAPLPDASLAPGELALIVTDAYDAERGFDVGPAPGTPLLRVAALASGLSNAGEPLQLRAPDGRIVSRFPADPAPEAGRSVARRQPWTLDDDAAGFARHADPGASPGAPNLLERP